MLEIRAWGHKNITATHYNTLEITKDNDLTTRGTCIVGVRANIATLDIPTWAKDTLRKDGSIVRFELVVGNQIISGAFQGHSDLILSHPKDIVIRKSTFICPRTLGIKSTIAAKDLPDDVRTKLRDPEQEILLRLYFE